MYLNNVPHKSAVVRVGKRFLFAKDYIISTFLLPIVNHKTDFFCYVDEQFFRHANTEEKCVPAYTSKKQTA